MTKNTEPAGLSSSPKPLPVQYRVIADRDKGADPTWNDVSVGDRYTAIATVRTYEDDPVVRIERPVPTTCTCPPLATSQEPEPDENCPRHGRLPSPHPPTREQIAEVLDSLARTLAFSSRDWGTNPRDAWLWGVLNGWDADEPGEESAMDEMARTHGWSEATVGRLRQFHSTVLALIRYGADR
jgi:hypothetical protein